jgi:hypothetical protein
MRRPLSLLLSLFCTVLWSCQKSPIEKNTGNSGEIISNVVSALADPTSISNGMKNYESYFLSSKDNKIHGYIISTPLNYSNANSTRYPLLVFMHGDGEKPGTLDYNLSSLKAHGPHKEIFNKGRAFPAIIVSIQMAKGEGVVNPAVVKELIDVITGEANVPNPTKGAVGLGKYNIDMNRIHLTGLSQGGNGTYKTANSYPNFFASISVFAGYTDGQSNMSAINIPTYIRHNNNDGVVSVQHAYNAQKWIDASKPSQPVDLLVFNSTSHDSWTTEYSRTNTGNVYDWHWSIARNNGSVGIPTVPPSNSSLAISTLSPALNSVNTINGYATLTVLFNNNIKKQTGLIEVKNLTDNTTEKIYANWGMVSVNSNRLSIYPVTLKNNKKYSVRIERGAFTDESGKPFAGITDDNTWTFSVGTVPATSEPSKPTEPSKPAEPTETTKPETNQGFLLSSFSPVNNSIITRPSNGYINLSMVFNADVLKGSGLIEVKNLTDNTSYKAYANWGMVSTSSKTSTVYPIPVVSGKTYAVTIASNAFKNSSGIFYAGINNTTTWKFTVK